MKAYQSHQFNIDSDPNHEKTIMSHIMRHDYPSEQHRISDILVFLVAGFLPPLLLPFPPSYFSTQDMKPQVFSHLPSLSDFSLPILAHTLSFVLYCLAKHPQALRKLQQELDQISPSFVENELPLLSLNDISKCEYLNCCIKETQRYLSSRYVSHTPTVCIQSLRSYPARSFKISNTKTTSFPKDRPF